MKNGDETVPVRYCTCSGRARRCRWGGGGVITTTYLTRLTHVCVVRTGTGTTLYATVLYVRVPKRTAEQLP